MISKLFLILFLALTSSCCVGATGEEIAITANPPVVCTEPRPQICTHDYNPVCATRNTEGSCQSPPCPATEKKTYSNGCAACSDNNVINYQPGSCETG